MAVLRHDFAFPFRIDGASGQAAQASYQDHVDQMIRQILLTDPGERADLPDFGAGMRRLIFAPLSQGLVATTQLMVADALNQWLAGQITVQSVGVQTAVDNAALPDGAILILVEYVLIETQSVRQTAVSVT
jgi:phage baseplate assembly protein W